MVIFHSKMLIYQRVTPPTLRLWDPASHMDPLTLKMRHFQQRHLCDFVRDASEGEGKRRGFLVKKTEKMVWQDWEGPKLHDVVSKCIEHVFFFMFFPCVSSVSPCLSLLGNAADSEYCRSSRPGRKRMVILSCISWVVGKSAHGRFSRTMTYRWQNYPHWVICNFFGTPPPPKKTYEFRSLWMVTLKIWRP